MDTQTTTAVVVHPKCRINPADVLAAFKAHADWTPMSGSLWRVDAQHRVCACCGLGAVALAADPDLLHHEEAQPPNNTARESPAMQAVVAVTRCPRLYVAEFGVGFDNGFDEILLGKPIEFEDEELALRRKIKIFGVQDGLESGRLVARWWQEQHGGRC